MGLFDNDPEYQALKELRNSGYDGPVDQDGKKATGKLAEIARDLRDKTAGKGR